MIDKEEYRSFFSLTQKINVCEKKLSVRLSGMIIHIVKNFAYDDTLTCFVFFVLFFFKFIIDMLISTLK